MTHLEKFINNVTPLDAKHLNELVNTLNTLIDKIEASQIDIGNLNDEIQNIDTLRTQLNTIKNTIDEHIENCSGGEIEFRVANGYIQWRYKGEESWNNLISMDILKGANGDKGERGEAGITPNITIGTVTTLEAGQRATVTRQGTNENPIFNFGIPKGESGVNSSGSNNLFIDDNTISTEKTWSSSKTEDFVLNNVGAIWQEINGGQMTIDSTMDGFLRKVEILGNTTQNQDDLSHIHHLGVWNEEKQGYEIEIVVSNSSSKDDLNYQEFRTTIILPCQLMKVKNVSDRLYWDSRKRRYVIEKNIDVKKITSARGYFFNVRHQNSNDYIKVWQVYCNGKIIRSKNGENGIFHNPIMSLCPEGFTDTITAFIKQSKYNELGYNNTDNDINKFLTENETRMVFQSYKTELIETDIREEIKLPTFINNTYVLVNGGIEGSIKAKAPVDGGKVIGVLQDENIKLKEINEVQDELINTTMLATDEMYMMLEPLLVNMFNDSKSINPLVNMYVAMINRGLKTMEHVPERYREQVKKIIEQSETELFI